MKFLELVAVGIALGLGVLVSMALIAGILLVLGAIVVGAIVGTPAQ